MKPEYIPTPSATAGPFLHIGLTDHHSVLILAPPEVAGERIWLTCRVFDSENVPVNDCMIEIWQADANGKYNHPDDPQSATADPSFTGFGRAATDDQGCCEFETIKPGQVPGPKGTMQAPHLNLAIYARGLLLQLHTRVYFAGETANDGDPVLALVPLARRATLLAQPDTGQPGDWHFDVHLRGDNETVFFDV